MCIFLFDSLNLKIDTEICVSGANQRLINKIDATDRKIEFDDHVGIVNHILLDKLKKKIGFFLLNKTKQLHFLSKTDKIHLSLLNLTFNLRRCKKNVIIAIVSLKINIYLKKFALRTKLYYFIVSQFFLCFFFRYTEKKKIKTETKRLVFFFVWILSRKYYVIYFQSDFAVVDVFSVKLVSYFLELLPNSSFENVFFFFSVQRKTFNSLLTTRRRNDNSIYVTWYGLQWVITAVETEFYRKSHFRKHNSKVFEHMFKRMFTLTEQKSMEN